MSNTVWGFPKSAQRRVRRVQRSGTPLTEENVKIAVCEIALDRGHSDDLSRLAELQERFPTDDPADMASMEFFLMWAVTMYEDPALGEPAVRRVLEHHQRAARLRRSWHR